MAYKFERLEIWQLALEYLNPELLRNAYRLSEKLFAKLQAFRASLTSSSRFKIREDSESYEYNDDIPF
jgi:hypothetical protein